MISPPTSSKSDFFTNLVLTGSLCAASLIASLAVSSSTPVNSNNTLPGLTTATQYSGVPLPEPIRVSAGFCVTGLSGKIFIQSFPPLLIYLFIAILADSIWLLVIQPHSVACIP
ncbi:ribosomal protein [Clostridium tetani E88]|uniref:Ribosomal protein n=1 Tax=Clostridium tetani (strain Massachusetts / E88) TaxID=212717 RepID=Q890P4_CLOTE|nr:ribosomal protein [Clostridium tetani E88]